MSIGFKKIIIDKLIRSNIKKKFEKNCQKTEYTQEKDV